ncbi:cobaltochelatase subunit-like protein [Methanothermobacter marburgensis str. Marburg]|uniref:Cobaltochelatase subunit-like protein n=2 Tax=Methanobacteriaceae TaxID=2159 RepID=D9PW44_METTM|nr:cobaltochelatase subunit-like protein [Methanothermobacter marburgensis str. Marburg]
MEVVDLPVSATEDMVVGTLDIRRALHEGIKALEPGLLARANGNILYIDEVNLLDDHVVNVLLDAAAMGVNIVEREGISVRHPSRFILAGTMNLEDLRPQIIDRFGLSVDVEALTDPMRG